MLKKTVSFIKFISLNFLLLLFSTFLFQTCSDDNSPTEPESQPSLASATIGSGGGTLKTDDFELIVPVGAFPNDTKLTLNLVENEDSGFDNIVSREFQLEGLPQSFSEPLTIKIKYTGELTDSSYIAIGENVWVSSLNEETTSYHLLSASESSGYISTQIAPTEDDNSSFLGKSTQDEIVTDGINIYAVTIKDYLSDEKHFKIFYNSSLNESYVKNIATYLETAYTNFQDLGFQYDRRTVWPIEVNLELGLKTNDGKPVYGLYATAFWSIYNVLNSYNAGYLRLNADFITDTEEMKLTIGHEFFHLVQGLYDTRGIYDKRSSPSLNYWINEASSVWAEALFSNDLNFVSDIYIMNADLAFSGAKLEKENPEEYGYGFASFITYLTKKYNDKVLLQIYDKIFEGNNSFQAINSAIGTKVDLLWNDFLTELFTFKLYKKKAQFTPTWLYSTAKLTNALFDIENESDTSRTFSKKITDLSAYIFAVKNSNDAISANSDLHFEFSGTVNNKILLFKQNSSESVFLKQGENSVTLENFRSITDAGYNIIAVVSNNKFNAPYTDVENLNLTIKVINKELDPTPVITEIVDALDYSRNVIHHFTLPPGLAMIRGKNFREDSKVIINGVESSIESNIGDTVLTFRMPKQQFKGNISVKVVTDAGGSNVYSYYSGLPLSFLSTVDEVKIRWRFLINNYDLPLILDPSDDLYAIPKSELKWKENVLTVNLSNVPNVSGSIEYTFSATENKIDNVDINYTRNGGIPNEVVHYVGEDFNILQSGPGYYGFTCSNTYTFNLLNEHTISMTGTIDPDGDGFATGFNSLKTYEDNQLLMLVLIFDY